MVSLRSTQVFSFLALVGTTLAARLNITAIGAHDGLSRFECWELNAPFMATNQTGLEGTRATALGDVSRMTYNVFPAGFDSPLHPAPGNQWVVLLKGLAFITLPNNTSTTFTSTGGETGLFFATDVAELSEQGHGTLFPGGTETLALQIPTEHNKIPKHRVLHVNKPCTASEYSQLRNWAVSS
ncbi:small secreted protein [Colletotrichum sojae]|uniref:Small secreted protein n=1 Tax=Colletotrichum sojae TaxID=2175907 RepID=A0A8H6IT22_9PEZI|nr:small secreted protein [Colletotrichum sojae]